MKRSEAGPLAVMRSECRIRPPQTLIRKTLIRQNMIRQNLSGSWDAFELENAALRLTVVPELGGKIVSLIRLESGREYFLEPPEPERAYRKRSYADRFEDYETSGFDECVPTVAECAYPEEPFLGNRLPDHGDVWCLPSSVDVAGEKICLTTHLRSLPLRFHKTVQLQETTVRLDYQVTNLSASTARFLWSAHPLLSIEPGAEIILPREVKEVEVGWSAEGRMGKPGDRRGWPEATDCSGRTVSLNRILAPSAGTAEKLFTGRLSEGFCGMFLPGEEQGILFRFDPRLVPYVGIWICQGGWPISRAAKHFTAALEPSMGRPDSLQESVARNECAVLTAHASIDWWMEIDMNAGAFEPLRTATEADLP